MSLITGPGIFPDITPEQYFAEPCPVPALTNSGIKMLVNSVPAKFAFTFIEGGADRRSSASQYRGKLVHRLALGKGDDYAISPFDEYRSAEAKGWKATTESKGIMPVKQKDFDAANDMAVIVKARIDEVCDGEHYETEVVIAWREIIDGFPVWCRAMIDVWCPALMLALDVKTCADASDEAVGRAFANGYATQDTWYRRGLETILAKHGRVRFGFLFVESDPPHLFRSATATEGFRSAAEFQCKRALATFAACMKSGEWPGYDELKVNPPAWLISQWAAAEYLEAA